MTDETQSSNDEPIMYGSQLKLHPTINAKNVAWEKRERLNRHSFKRPELNSPYWLVYCPEAYLEFSTVNWDQGLCPRNECLYCQKKINYKHG